MRKLLMIASAAAMAATMPAVAKGPGGGKGNGGGDKHEHKSEHRGGGGKHEGRGGGKPDKAERGFARQEFRAERRAERREFKPDKQWAKREEKRDKDWRKADKDARKEFAKREEKRFERRQDRFRDDREFRRAERRDRFDDDRLLRGDERRMAIGYDEGCPPGLAKKRNGCLPPGQAKKLYRVGEALPLAAFAGYNLPSEYRDFYYDNSDYSYRYDEGNIYRVNNETNLVSALIPLLGGGFSVGNLLPSGYDAYNVPYQYRDDYYDTEDAYYRYGDDAIYQVDPQTQMIEAVVALLAGDLNVGQLLPTGYDTYNLPMDYRDQYADSDEAMYRYADGNIYEIDPQTRIIEEIVAQLV